MSYISGRGDVTSTVTTHQPVDQAIRGRQGPTVADRGRPWFVPDLYRALAREVVDTALAVALLPLTFPAVLAVGAGSVQGGTR